MLPSKSYANFMPITYHRPAFQIVTNQYCSILLGLLCYKLITIVNCYLETGLTCFVYCPKALYLIIFIVWLPF